MPLADFQIYTRERNITEFKYQIYSEKSYKTGPGVDGGVLFSGYTAFFQVFAGTSQIVI